MLLGRRFLAAFFGCLLAVLVTATAWAAGEDEAGYSAAVMLSTGEEDARCAESPLGLVAADAVRACTGADVAIVCGGDLHADLPAGRITYAKVAQIFAEDQDISVAEVTPVRLRDILEAGLSHITLDLDNGDKIDREASAFGGFPQVSGMTFRYDASALPGERVLEIMVGGKELSLDDDETVLILAASEYLLSGGYESPVAEERRNVGVTLSQAFLEYLQSFPDGLEKPTSRMIVIGAGDNSIVSRVFPRRGLAVLAVVLLLCFGVLKSNRNARTGKGGEDELLHLCNKKQRNKHFVRETKGYIMITAKWQICRDSTLPSRAPKNLRRTK